MKDIAIERARKHHKCPYCNNEVSTVKLGELFGNKAKEFVDIVKHENLKIDSFGIIFGDDRDSCYICHNCNKEFDENMELIEYINDCLIMQSGCILKKDCKNYTALKNKYKGYKLKSAEVCKKCRYY
ncbi:MAG: hypothetical protein J6M60_03925 [Clostridia bacterium]|nr:hypothetical protein [Clostridia bacterium]